MWTRTDISTIEASVAETIVRSLVDRILESNGEEQQEETLSFNRQLKREEDLKYV